MDFLYISESSSQYRYDACQGELEINRLLEGADKIFRLPYSGQLKKRKKILVLSDPTCSSWTQTKLRDVEACFDALNAEGFVVHYLGHYARTWMVWGKSSVSVQAYSERFNNIYALGIKNNQELIDIHPKLQDYPQNHLLFLDTHVIAQLVDSLIYHRAPAKNLQLGFSELVSCFNAGMDMSRLQEVLTQRHSDKTEWVVDEYSSWALALAENFEQRGQGNVRWAINKVRLADDARTKDFVASLSNSNIQEKDFDQNHVAVIVNSLNMLEAFMRVKHPENIHTLTFENIDFSDSVSFSMLRKLKDIEHLSFFSCKRIDQAAQALSQNWGQLKSLSTSNLTDTSKEIFQSMTNAAAPTLEKLHIRSQKDDLLKGWGHVRKINHLIDMSFAESIMEHSLLEKFISCVSLGYRKFDHRNCVLTNIPGGDPSETRLVTAKELEVESSGYIAYLGSSTSERVSNLERCCEGHLHSRVINFSGVKGEIAQFQEMLEKQKEVKHLMLRNAEYLTDRMLFENLEIMTIDSRLRGGELKRVGQVAPVLKNLTIIEPDTSCFHDDMAISFPFLEELTMSRVQCTYSVLKLIHSAQRLQNLQLFTIADLCEEDVNVSHMSLRQLFVHCRVQSKIGKLLSCFPNVKRLTLHKLSDEIDLDVWKKFSLWKGLTHLEIKNSYSLFDKILTFMPLESIISLAVGSDSVNNQGAHKGADWIEKIGTHQENHFVSLKEIRLFGLPNPRSSMWVIRNAPNLRLLLIELTDERCKELLGFRDFLNLENLTISHSAIEGELLTRLLEKMPRLRVLVADKCYIKGAVTIPEHLVYLADISLKQTEVVPGQGEKLDARILSALIRGGMSLQKKTDENNVIGNDTNNTNSSFNETYLFIGQDGAFPKPSSYRRSIYNHVVKRPGIFDRSQSAFELKLYGKESLKDCPHIEYCDSEMTEIFKACKKNAHKFYLAKTRVFLRGTWSVLPSLDANELMTHVYAGGLRKNEIEIKYCKLRDVYCVRYCGRGGRHIDIHFILCVPEKKQKLTRKLEKRVREYSRVNDQGLPDTCVSGDANYWLAQFSRTRAGRCSQKSVSFFEESKSECHAIRYISNISHAYVEVKQTEHSLWVKCDLGGYSSVSNIDNGQFGVDESCDQDDEPQEIHAQTQPISAPANAAFMNDNETQSVTVDSFQQALQTQYISQNILLNVSDEEAAWHIQYLLRRTASQNNLPTYYIHTPDDLRCTGRHMVRGKNNEGLIVNEPYGPLYDFIVMSKNKRCILIVNFIQFTAEEIVRFNTIIDKVRKVDGIVLGESLTVLGLYHADNPHAYKGLDFYSRFHERINLELGNDISYQGLMADPPSFDEASVMDINLFESDAWKSILFGDWELNAQGCHFREGPFFEALKKNHSIRLCSPPINDRDFVNFIAKVELEHRVIVAGNIIELPSGFTMHVANTAPSETSRYMTDANTNNKYLKFRVVNPNNFSMFFKSYRVSGGMLLTEPGWVQQAQTDGELTVILDESLGIQRIKRLEAFCEQHNVKLRSIAVTQAILSPMRKKFINNVYTTQLYESLLWHRRNFPDDVIIDCTNLTVADLLGSIVYKSTEKGFSFSKTDGAIRQVLSTGKNLVLTGDLSSDSAVALLESDLHPIFPQQSISIISHANLGILDAFFEKTIKETPPALKNLPHEYFQDSSLCDMKARSQALRQAMSVSPLILLTGPTGVGKSTFILDYYACEQDIELHVGESSIDSWQTSTTPGKKKVLFIDEANIATSSEPDWTEFSGLLNNSPPSVIINGVIKTLTPDHIVVFAGNPSGYGGERYVPALFKNYPIAKVHFQQLSSEYIAQQVLAPILGHDQNYAYISAVFMDVYQKVIDLSQTHPFITPRDLEHMAHLYMIHQNPALAASAVLKHLVAPHDFERIMGKTFPPVYVHSTHTNHFLITKSRIELASRLNEFLTIRDYKLKRSVSGGLGGILIEGEPGIGKSEQVLAQFAAHGLVEGDDYFVVPATASYEEKIEILTMAFHAGAIVLIDELNSSPALERFFNDALSGRLDGVPAAKPGFMLVATQNPTHYDGRRELSMALYRRLLHCKVEPYTRDELVSIVEHAHDIDSLIAREIVNDFYCANQQRETPLTCRDLLKRIDDAILGIWKTAVERENSHAIFDKLSKFYLEDRSQSSYHVGSSEAMIFLKHDYNVALVDIEDDNLLSLNPAPCKKIKLESASPG